jgi:hypothetical protein
MAKYTVLFAAVGMHSTPSIVPIEMFGQVCGPCGHIFFAFFQISSRAILLHSRRMCCIDSVLSHPEHIALLPKPGMLSHLSLIMYVLCIVLCRNCCTCGLSTGFLELLIVASVSLVPFIFFPVLRFKLLITRSNRRVSCT